MDIKEALNEFRVIFSIPLFPERPVKILGAEISSIDITETVLVSWVVMALLIAASFFLTRRLREVPRGAQTILEALVEFLDAFSKAQFGHRAGVYGPYIGTIFLFLLGANIIPAVSPVAAFGQEPPFSIRPPTRDINLTAAMAILSILLVLIGGLRARGFRPWCKNLLRPMPMMLPFNLLEYLIRPASMCLRLFGNILGGLIIMLLIESAVPIGVPPVLSLYFDFLDGLIQALVFTFLTTLFIAEAVEVSQ
ncbi:MAG: F0F1 ATP synthase subunit A [Spirochaetaceae bacterium]|jgi:F-type H+-transporting ATPase subunit a|nr:F0F1 ATP synthase subunit A [Spirochaetaceae bacterium]